MYVVRRQNVCFWESKKREENRGGEGKMKAKVYGANAHFLKKKKSKKEKI